MEPTSDERREVAEQLRKHNGHYYEELVNMSDSDLADLIDPTCHMTDSRWDNGECTWGCICSDCGARIEHEYASDIDYCPRCGARVVSDDDACRD